MNIQSATYRIASAVVAWTVLLGTVLPNGLNAHTLFDKLCLPAHAAETMNAHCDITAGQNTPADTGMNDHANNTCDFEYDCACSVNETPVVPLAANQFANNTIAVHLPGKKIIGNADILPPSPGPDQSILRFETSPPIFLQKSSFLN